MTRKAPTAPTPPDTRNLWDAKDVGEYLKLSAYTVSEMARKGLLPSHKIGRNVRFIPAEIDRYVQRASA